MQIDDIEKIIYTFQFIVPGYIIERIISSVCPQKSYELGEKAVRSIGYSIFNMAVWYWLFKLIYNLNLIPIWYWILMTIAIVVTGGITGFIIGIIRKKGWTRALLQKFGITVEHPTPTAWDYIGSEGKEYFVEVTLVDNKVLRGLYSSKSFMSSDESFRDIYLETLYIKNKDDNPWVKLDRTRGVWVEPKQIRFIKFYSIEEENNA